MKKEIKKSLGNLKKKVVPASEVPIPEKKLWGMDNILKNQEIDAQRLHPNTDKDLIKHFQNKYDKFEGIEFHKVDQISTQTSWITEIENFCNKEGITPLELIKAYKTKGKSKKIAKTEDNEATNKESIKGLNKSNWRKDFIKAKCGF